MCRVLDDMSEFRSREGAGEGGREGRQMCEGTSKEFGVGCVDLSTRWTRSLRKWPSPTTRRGSSFGKGETEAPTSSVLRLVNVILCASLMNGWPDFVQRYNSPLSGICTYSFQTFCTLKYSFSSFVQPA